MKSNPLVSVIIPIYNAEKTIERCIKSIIDQTYNNIEIILIDDGSSDNSFNKCNEFINKYSDKSIQIYHQKNSGVSCARNKGIQISKGEYICFIDSDDWIENKTIEFLVEASNKHNIELVIPRTKILIYNKNGELIETRYDNDENEFIISYKQLGEKFEEIRKYGILYSTCGRLYNKDFLKNNQIYFDEKIGILEDFAFNLKCLNKVQCIMHINYIAYAYVVENVNEYTKKRNCITYINGIDNVYEQFQQLCNNLDINNITGINDFLLGYWGITVDEANKIESKSDRNNIFKLITNKIKSEKLLENYTRSIIPTEKRILYKYRSFFLYLFVLKLKKIKEKLLK